jgi:hypothetical protein
MRQRDQFAGGALVAVDQLQAQIVTGRFSLPADCAECFGAFIE